MIRKNNKKTQLELQSENLKLISLEISFYVSGVPKKDWFSFAKKAGLQIEDTEVWSIHFVALPDKAAKHAEFLSGDIHAHPTNGKTHCVFTIKPTPNNPPPKSVKESSKLIGGYPNAISKIAKLWPTNKTIKAEIDADFFLIKKDSLGDSLQAFFKNSKLKDFNTEFIGLTAKKNKSAIKRVAITTDNGVTTDALLSIKLAKSITLDENFFQKAKEFSCAKTLEIL